MEDWERDGETVTTFWEKIIKNLKEREIKWKRHKIKKSESGRYQKNPHFTHPWQFNNSLLSLNQSVDFIQLEEGMISGLA